MKVFINPTNIEKGCGLTAASSWEGALPALNALFGIRDGERIEQLEVDANGLTVRIAKEPT